MDSDLVRFVVLVIPGLLGYMAYHSLIPRLDDESTTIETIKILVFGIVGYLAAITFARYVEDAGFCELITQILEHLLLPLQTLVSSLVSYLTGMMYGRYVKVHGDPFVKHASIFCEKKGLALDTLSANSFNHLYDCYFADQRASHQLLAAAYSISSTSNQIIGAIDSWNEKEIVLSESPFLTREDINNAVKKGNASYGFKIINLDSGYIVEIIAIEKEFIENIYEEQTKALEKN